MPSTRKNASSYHGTFNMTNAYFRKGLILAALATLLVSPVTPSAHAAQPAGVVAQSGKRVATPDETISIALSDDWEIERDKFNFVARNETEGLVLLVSNSYAVDGKGVSTIAKAIVKNWELEGATISNPTKVKLNKLGDAEQIDITSPTDDGKRYVRIQLHERNGRAFTFISIGDTRDLKTHTATLDAIFATAEISNKVFGLERSQVIALPGGRMVEEFMDPATFTGSADSYVGQLFSGLVRLTPQLQIEADLAERWKISPDGKVYTFTLRPGAAFADGKAITTADVIYSWERAASPKTKSSTAGTYLGDIEGVKDVLAGKAKAIRGVKAIDARTLQVTLDNSKPFFLAKLTYPTSYIVDQRDVKRDAKKWMLKPNASGPYTLKRYDEDTVAIFERNPKYHIAPKTPYVVHYINLGGSRLSLFQAKQLDIVYVSREDYKLISEPSHPLHNNLRPVAAMCSRFLMFDTAQAPMDDIEVRRAFAQAIDWDALAKINQDDYDTESWHVIPPQLPGAQARERTLVFDPAGAKASLQRSKYAAKLPKITITLAGDGTTENDFYSAMVGMLRKNLGATVEIDYIDSETFAREARKKHGQIVPYGWCADYPDPENFLDVLFHSKSDFNVAALKDAQFDGYVEKARTEQDVTKRLALYGQAEQRLYDEVLTVPMPRTEGHMLVQSYIESYTPTGIGVQQLFRVSVKK
jgi:ABC-type oligopeptide transport system substrate-binding subunit